MEVSCLKTELAQREVTESLLDLNQPGIALLEGESPPDGSGELVPEGLGKLARVLGDLFADALASLLVDDREVTGDRLSDDLRWTTIVP